jgi:hypothetical protein
VALDAPQPINQTETGSLDNLSVAQQLARVRVCAGNSSTPSDYPMNGTTTPWAECDVCNSTFCLEWTRNGSSNGTQVHRSVSPSISPSLSCCQPCPTLSPADESSLSSHIIYLTIFAAIVAFLIASFLIFLAVIRARHRRTPQSPEESTSQGFKRQRIADWVYDAGRQIFDPVVSTSSEARRQEQVETVGQISEPITEEAPRRSRPALPPIWVQYVPGGIQESVDGLEGKHGNETDRVRGVVVRENDKTLSVSHVSMSDQFGRMTTSSERSRSITESKSESR